jgi:hypothetical protein
MTEKLTHNKRACSTCGGALIDDTVTYLCPACFLSACEESESEKLTDEQIAEKWTDEWVKKPEVDILKYRRRQVTSVILAAIQDAVATKDAKLAEQANLIKGIGGEMKETLYMLRTGATNEQLDYRVRNALALFEAR